MLFSKKPGEFRKLLQIFELIVKTLLFQHAAFKNEKQNKITTKNEKLQKLSILISKSILVMNEVFLAFIHELCIGFD